MKRSKLVKDGQSQFLDRKIKKSVIPIIYKCFKYDGGKKRTHRKQLEINIFFLCLTANSYFSFVLSPSNMLFKVINSLLCLRAINQICLTIEVSESGSTNSKRWNNWAGEFRSFWVFFQVSCHLLWYVCPSIGLPYPHVHGYR